MKGNRLSILVTGALLLATFALAGMAAAQEASFSGRFTLPYEVRWGKAALPVGEYWLRAEYDGNAARRVTVGEAKTGKVVAVVLTPIAELNPKGESALLISVRGKEHIVHLLRVAEFNKTYIYEPSLAHPRGAEKAQSRRSTPRRQEIRVWRAQDMGGSSAGIAGTSPPIPPSSSLVPIGAQECNERPVGSSK